MENNGTMVYFSLRESKQNREGKSPIEVSISLRGERIYFSTGKKVSVDDWNKSKQIVRGKTDEAIIINDFLSQFRNKIFQKEIELVKNGYVVTVNLLKDAVLDKIDSLNQKTLLALMQEHNKQKKLLLGNSVAPATYWIFEYSLRLFTEFITFKYKRKDLYLHEINLGFIQSFHVFLLGNKKMAQNTCTKHLKFLKKIMNMAVANGYISYNMLNVYKVEREPVDIDYLNEDELRKIINFDTPILRFERARDMFLFGCFTGLSYIDIKTLSAEHFEKDSDGRIWIKKCRVKTGVLSRIPLLPIAKLILDKYKGGTKVLPIQDSSDINKYLKDIAILCNINKHITFHTSRHTFATTVTLSNNISLEVVSKMLGHTNTRMTTHYAKLIDRCIAEQMDRLVDTFSGNGDSK